MATLRPLLDRIDRAKARWDGLRPLSPEQLALLRDDWEITHTFHSNAIEGSTLTLGETKAVLVHGITIAGKPLREHLEAVNHREAMRLVERLATSTTPVTEAELLELHRAILTGIQSDDAGRYHTVRVRVAGSRRVFPNPAVVPEQVAVLLGEVEAVNAHPVVVAARLHHGLVAIHPFVDGNGRTARLLSNLRLARDGYPPALLRCPPPRQTLAAAGIGHDPASA